MHESPAECVIHQPHAEFTCVKVLILTIWGLEAQNRHLWANLLSVQWRIFTFRGWWYTGQVGSQSTSRGFLMDWPSFPPNRQNVFFEYGGGDSHIRGGAIRTRARNLRFLAFELKFHAGDGFWCVPIYFINIWWKIARKPQIHRVYPIFLILCESPPPHRNHFSSPELATQWMKWNACIQTFVDGDG